MLNKTLSNPIISNNIIPIPTNIQTDKAIGKKVVKIV